MRFPLIRRRYRKPRASARREVGLLLALAGPLAVTPLALTGVLRPLAALLYMAAVAASTLVGGLRSGLPAVVLSTVLLHLYFLPSGSLVSPAARDVAAGAAFAVVALSASELLARFNRARAEAQAARQRFSFLVTASSVLGSSLDYQKTLNDLARLATSRLADWCAVDLLREDGVIENVAVAPSPNAGTQSSDKLPRDPNVRRGVRFVIREGRSELYPNVPEGLLVDAKGGDGRASAGRLASVIIAPLSAQGRTFGALTLVAAESGRVYNEDDRRLAEDLADRAAMAIENARLHLGEGRAREAADRVARTLQRGLLPPDLPEIPGIELATMYLPVGEATEVGGDFYDAFETAGGGWAVLIGDVCGKGPEAAALTGLVRHSARAVAAFERDPVRILAQVNQLLLAQAGSDRFCTVCCLTVQPHEGGATLEGAIAGNPLPFIVSPSGGVTPLGRPGQPLGLLSQPLLYGTSTVLRPGELVVLYTDGLIDPRAWKDHVMPEKLHRWLEDCAGLEATEVIDRFQGLLAGVQPRDDIAIVAVRARGRSGTRGSAELSSTG